MGAHQCAIGCGEQARIAILVKPGEDRLRGDQRRLGAREELDRSGTVGASQRRESTAVVDDAVAAPPEQHDIDLLIGGEQSTSGVEAQVGEVRLHHLDTHPTGIGPDDSRNRLAALNSTGSSVDRAIRGHE
jgi:hypothetical protein